MVHICKDCILRKAVSVCPKCHGVLMERDFSGIEESSEILQWIDFFKEMKCGYDYFHLSDAHFYCTNHVLPLCNAHQSEHSSCELLLIPDQYSAVRYELLTKLREPGDINDDIVLSAHKSGGEGMSSNGLVKAVRLKLAKLPVCGNGNVGRYFDFESFEVVNNTENQLNAVQIRPSQEFLQQVESAVILRLRILNYDHMNPSYLHYLQRRPYFPQYQFDLPRLFVACFLLKSANLTKMTQWDPCCPQCGKHYKELKAPLRKLPCSKALHAACELCLQHRNMVRCPLDGYVYMQSVEFLEIIETKRKRQFEDVFLAGKGRFIPKFEGDRGVLAAERFIDVLPSRLPLAINDSSEAFNAPWKANFHLHQVECLSFTVLSRDIQLVGFGISSLLLSSPKASISSAKLYRNSHACGANYSSIPLKNNKIETDPLVVTDIYFNPEVLINCGETVTLKVTVDSGNRVSEMFHGNHIGGFADLVGEDNTEFEVRPTERVDEGESLGGSHQNSPLLRLLYV